MPIGRQSNFDQSLRSDFLSVTAHLSSSDAARFAGIDPQTVMNWRRGRTNFMRRPTRLRVEAFLSAHGGAATIVGKGAGDR
jgi:hypothetical protein